MRFITWNVDKGLRTNQVPFLVEAAPDVVALQEVSGRHRSFTRASLEQLGLRHVLHTPEGERGSAYGLVLASRWPLLRVEPGDVGLDVVERVLCAVLDVPGGSIEVTTVHVPPGMRKVAGRPDPSAKIQTFQALTEFYGRPATAPRVLLGDFNTPQDELVDGTQTFFGNAHQRGVEEAFYRVASRQSLRDTFRILHFTPGHGFAKPAVSWLNKGNRASSRPRRFDHVFASPELRVVSANYADAERIWNANVSDHLPLTVEFDVGTVV